MLLLRNIILSTCFIAYMNAMTHESTQAHSETTEAQPVDLDMPHLDDLPEIDLFDDPTPLPTPTFHAPSNFVIWARSLGIKILYTFINLKAWLVSTMSKEKHECKG